MPPMPLPPLFLEMEVITCIYHSLVIEKESFPVDELEITAWTEDGLVMAARHKKYKHLQMESDELIPIDIEYEREDLDLEDELDEVAELPPPKKAKTKSKNKTNNEDKKRRTSTIWRFF
ncbi:hypothetical protein ACB098_05G086500 [Castanea mollissima]